MVELTPAGLLTTMEEPEPPCRNRRYFKTTILEKDLHQLMMDLGFQETTGRSKSRK